VVQERLDARRADLVAVGVGLAEVVRARDQGRELFRRAPEAAAGAHEVARGVEARRKPRAQPLEDGLLGVGPVGTEVLAQPNHVVGLLQQRIEGGVVVFVVGHHVSLTRAKRRRTDAPDHSRVTAFRKPRRRRTDMGGFFTTTRRWGMVAALRVPRCCRHRPIRPGSSIPTIDVLAKGDQHPLPEQHDG